MMVMMQLWKLFPDNASRQGLISHFELIKDDVTEGFLFQEYMNDMYGIELTDSQVERLILACRKESYKSLSKLSF
jgi:hypothetical protein